MIEFLKLLFTLVKIRNEIWSWFAEASDKFDSSFEINAEFSYWHARVTTLEDVVLALGMQSRMEKHHQEWLKED